MHNCKCSIPLPTIKMRELVAKLWDVISFTFSRWLIGFMLAMPCSCFTVLLAYAKYARVCDTAKPKQISLTFKATFCLVLAFETNKTTRYLLCTVGIRKLQEHRKAEGDGSKHMTKCVILPPYYLLHSSLHFSTCLSVHKLL